MTVYGMGKDTSTRGSQLSDVELFVLLLLSVLMQFSVLMQTTNRQSSLAVSLCGLQIG